MVEAWYRRKDARFECQKCGGCCSGAPGYVFLSRADLVRLLRGFRLEFRVFLRDYCVLVDAGDSKVVSLRETKRIRNGKPSNDCVFLGDSGCTAYDFRPEQCRSYPFWFGVADDENAWNDEARSCPGIGRGDRVDPDHIEECLWRARAYPPLRLPRGADGETIDEIAILGSAGFDSDAGQSPADAEQDFLDRPTDPSRGS